MSPLGKTHKLLHSQECQNAGQHPQANDHILHVIVPMRVLLVVVVMGVVIIISHMILVTVAVGGNGVRNEVEEGVAQQSSRGETEEDLEERGVFCGILEGDEEENEERSGTDEEGGSEGIAP